MKFIKKLAIATMAGAMILSGCGGDKGEVDPEKKVEKKISTNQNLLTGENTLTKEAIGKRPVAVMVNNIEPAMPQYGIEQADIIFEIPVEADLTRFMALYGDYTQVPDICPIRSCRLYFPTFAMGYDAVYVHWGMSSDITKNVDGLGVDRIDGMSESYGLFGRDQSRLDSGYSLEHTGMLYGTKLAPVLEENFRTDLEEDYKTTAFKFNKKEKSSEGEDCTVVDINFGNQGSTFIYDEINKVYLKQINENNQIDAKTGNQLAFKNVIVMETEIGIASNGVHKDVNCKGGEDSVAYYISNGKVQEIHWEKENGDAKSRLVFFDDNGKEIKVNKGKTYIAVNYANQTNL